MAGTIGNSGSIIYNQGNRTGTALSTNIIIKVNHVPIGAVQEISFTETRGIHMIDEVGTDGHIDSAPNASTNITGRCSRVRFDRLRITEAFSRGFVHIHAQRYPFDLDIYDISKGDGNNSIITTLSNVWINNLTYTYSASNFIITDAMDFMAEGIRSVYNGSNQSVASGGSERGDVVFYPDAVEQDADTGGRRGSMDAPGLIDAFVGKHAF